jgi:hypothetical protein
MLHTPAMTSDISSSYMLLCETDIVDAVHLKLRQRSKNSGVGLQRLEGANGLLFFFMLLARLAAEHIYTEWDDFI